MKIRSDFVTNSSSSDYCDIHITGSKIAEILNRYKELLKSEGILLDEEDMYKETGIRLDDNEVFLGGELRFSNFGPEKKDEIADCFIELIYELLDDCDPKNREEFDKMIKELHENKKEINSTITQLDWEYGEGCFDHEAYEKLMGYNYDDDFIRSYMNLDKGTEITHEIDKEVREKIANKYYSTQEVIRWKYEGGEIEKTDEVIFDDLR